MQKKKAKYSRTPGLKTLWRLYRRRKKLRFYIFLFFISFFSFGLFSQEPIQEWVKSYSSQDYESPTISKNQNKVYHYWQIESLKRAISPRYIRMVDIQNYRKNYQLLNTGILFTYNGLRNNHVSICGNFSAWQCLPMKKNRYGIFFILIAADYKDSDHNPLATYRYRFKIDDFFDYDVENPNRLDDGFGSYLSEFHLENTDTNRQASFQIKDLNVDEGSGFRTVEFRIYRPEAMTISVVGNFNRWNPGHDYLTKGEDGIFRLEKKLRPGEYLYHFIIDGTAELDTYNKETRYRADTGELSSYLKLEKKM